MYKKRVPNHRDALCCLIRQRLRRCHLPLKGKALPLQTAQNGPGRALLPVGGGRAGGGGFLQVMLKKGVTRADVDKRLGEVFQDSDVGVYDAELM